LTGAPATSRKLNEIAARNGAPETVRAAITEAAAKIVHRERYMKQSSIQTSKLLLFLWRFVDDKNICIIA
jgi:hypothetical protein